MRVIRRAWSVVHRVGWLAGLGDEYYIYIFQFSYLHFLFLILRKISKQSNSKEKGIIGEKKQMGTQDG
jgi:hypothetical protein